jgi:large repetitive protein
MTQSDTPVQVSGLSGVVAIAGGYFHSLALKSDWTVWAWGYNLYGELGNGTTTQSDTPVQVSGLSGVVAIAGGDYLSLALVSPNTYTIGGTVSGLSGTGLVLQDNSGDNLAVSTNGSFTFATAIATGNGYSVTVLTQPTGPAETCSVTNGSGTVASANVTNVSVACSTNTYTIGGTVSGLSGTGLVLQDNSGDNLAVTTNGNFTFATAIASGGAYSVTVSTQPTGPSQTCIVTSGSGTVASANVTNVSVTCTTNTYTIGGTVSGLSGTGLVLQDNAGNNLPITSNGNFSFTTAIASGGGYSVTVYTQPSSPAQTCIVTNGSGTVTSTYITNVLVSCITNTYTIGGTVSGLAGTGLVLQDNLGNNLTVSANGTFTFSTAIASGGAYGVTVLTQPSSPTQNCVVTSGSGTVASANVTNVSVTCSTNTYTIGGTVSGLAAADSVVLQDNSGNNLTVAANGSFTFTTAIASGAGYSVSVFTQPTSPSQTCSVSSGSGTVASANVTNVLVACSTNTYTIGGTVSGLSGTGLVLQDNAGNNLAVSSNGTFTFTTPVASGGGYSVTVYTQPSSPAQTCSVSNASGTVASANVTNVLVACTTNTYTVGGTISGLSGTGLVLQDNAGNNLPVSANGTFTFTTPIASGGGFSVTVYTQPSSPAQTCGVTNGSGTVTTANVTNVLVACTTNTPKDTPTIDWLTPFPITYGTPLSGAQLNAVAVYKGSIVSGTFVYTPPAGTVLGAGSQTLSVTFTPSNATVYSTATGHVTLQVNRALPRIAWSTPAAITYGTALSGTQLDASSSVFGSFKYSPAAGTVLDAGVQILSVTFTPMDTTDYTTAADAVVLTVERASSVTAITSNTPNPSLINQAVTVSFQVTGVGVGPTGSVIVIASTGETCSGALSAGAGKCSLTFRNASSRTLTAEYPGDINFNGSSSAKVTQTVQK